MHDSSDDRKNRGGQKDDPDELKRREKLQPGSLQNRAGFSKQGNKRGEGRKRPRRGLPWKSRLNRTRIGRTGGRRHADATKLRPVAERRPRGHAFAPGEVGSVEATSGEAGDDILGGEDPELLLVTSDVDLHDLLIGEMNTLASLGPPQPIGRKKGQTAKAMKAAATHAAQKPATAKANRGFQAPSRWAARSETDR